MTINFILYLHKKLEYESVLDLNSKNHRIHMKYPIDNLFGRIMYLNKMHYNETIKAINHLFGNSTVYLLHINFNICLLIYKYLLRCSSTWFPIHANRIKAAVAAQKCHFLHSLFVVKSTSSEEICSVLCLVHFLMKMKYLERQRVPPSVLRVTSQKL